MTDSQEIRVVTAASEPHTIRTTFPVGIHKHHISTPLWPHKRAVKYDHTALWVTIWAIIAVVFIVFVNYATYQAHIESVERSRTIMKECEQGIRDCSWMKARKQSNG